MPSQDEEASPMPHREATPRAVTPSSPRQSPSGRKLTPQEELLLDWHISTDERIETLSQHIHKAKRKRFFIFGTVSAAVEFISLLTLSSSSLHHSALSHHRSLLTR